MLCGCATKPYVVKYEGQFSGKGKNVVYVVSNGWHTSLIVSAEKIQAIIPELKDRFGNSRYIGFGWGDEDFYKAKEITSGLKMQAIFWPTESVIHAVSIPINPYDNFPNSQVQKLCLNDAELMSMLIFIGNSFFKDSQSKVSKLTKGIYGNSQFYKGVGKYYLMNTCNKWTAKGLKSAGMNISTEFKLTAHSVMNYVKQYNQSTEHQQGVFSTSLISSDVSCQ